MQARYHHHMPPSATVVTARHIFINFTFDSRKIAGARSKDENDQRSTLIIRINDLPQSSTSSFKSNIAPSSGVSAPLLPAAAMLSFSWIHTNIYIFLSIVSIFTISDIFCRCVRARDALKQEHH